MKLLYLSLLFALGCSKKTEGPSTYIMPINDPIEIEDDDLDDLPEADDTGVYIEEDYFKD